MYQDMPAHFSPHPISQNHSFAPQDPSLVPWAAPYLDFSYPKSGIFSYMCGSVGCLRALCFLISYSLEPEPTKPLPDALSTPCAAVRAARCLSSLTTAATAA